MFKITHRGSYDHIQKYLNRLSGHEYLNKLNSAAQRGCEILASVTPAETGETANCWTYEIEHGHDKTIVHWLNTAENGDFQIALSLQHGHGTGTGGWVQGRDFINPAIQPLMDQIVDDIWKGVTSL